MRPLLPLFLLLLLAGCAARVPAPYVAGDPVGRLADLAAPADSVRAAAIRTLTAHGFPLDPDASAGFIILTGYRPEADSLADGRRLRAEARVVPVNPALSRLWLLLVEASPGAHLPQQALPPDDPAYAPILEAIAAASR